MVRRKDNRPPPTLQCLRHTGFLGAGSGQRSSIRLVVDHKTIDGGRLQRLLNVMMTYGIKKIHNDRVVVAPATATWQIP